MHVSLTAEKIFDLGPLPVTNALLTTWLVVFLTIVFAIIFRMRIKQHPSGMQNVVELAIEGFHGLVESVTNNFKQARKFFPVIFTIFLFVLLNNWAGLLPGVGSVGLFGEAGHATEAHEPHGHHDTPTEVNALTHGADAHAENELTIPESELTHEYTEAIDSEFSSPHVVNLDEGAEVEAAHDAPHAEEGHHATFVPIFRAGSADLSFTLALAFVAVLLVQVAGVGALGGGYFKKFLNFSNPIHFFVGILEVISEFSKMISFSFRLFGNVFAGEVLLAVIIALAPFIAPMPFYGLEIFVGLIQALVFSVLTLVFFKGATAAH